MADDLLRSSDVKREYGYSRSTLLRYEQQGAISPQYTPGGQRRYTRGDIENLTSNNKDGVTDELSEVARYKEWGNTGYRKWGSAIWEEQVRELRGRNGKKLLREMRLNDPVIGAVFFAVENSLKQAEWRVAPASEKKQDREAAAFVQQCMDDMSFTWSDTLSFILVCLEQGFSVLEIIYKKRTGESPDLSVLGAHPSKYDDGRIGWRKWAPRPAETLVDGNEFIIDEHGGINGIRQENNVTNEIIEIPIEKLLLFRTTVVPANNPEGMPIHRSMYIPWWYSNNIMEIEGIGIERDLAGLPVVYLGEDATMQGPNSDYQIALDLVTNVRVDEQMGIVLPKPKMGDGAAEGKGILFELQSSGGRRQYDTNAIIERYDKRKALAVLAQFIMLGMEKVGSFALGKQQSDLFAISVKSWLMSFADVINRHAIPKLMNLNVFPGITGYPKLVPGVVGVPDLEGIALFVNQMVEKEVITPDVELERHIRQLANLPPLKEEEYDDEGNVIEGTGVGKQNVSLDKAALLVRRVGLAVQSMQKTGALSEEQGAVIMQPLVQELQDAMTNELLLGGTLSRQKISPPTQFETDEEEGVKETSEEESELEEKEN